MGQIFRQGWVGALFNSRFQGKPSREHETWPQGTRNIARSCSANCKVRFYILNRLGVDAEGQADIETDGQNRITNSAVNDPREKSQRHFRKPSTYLCMAA